ncbi:MAG: calcium:proton antiporter, partial [Lysobacterales bacterium]
IALGASASCAVIFVVFGDHWFNNLTHFAMVGGLFVWLFAVIMWSAFAIVRHADSLAARLGEPYGTLILTLAVISIEVMMISAVMVNGEDNPTLARDTMYAVVMIALNGMVGVTLLLGGLRHREQQYNLQGANAFLAVIVPLAFLGLVLPNYTRATDDGSCSAAQAAFMIVLSVGIYAVFLAIQTVRHRSHFLQPQRDLKDGPGTSEDEHGLLEPGSSVYHALLLVLYLAPLVVLSKKLAFPIDHGIEVLGFPPALGGFLVAVLILSPEALGAARAALNNQLQRSINILLGSVLATISLTIPAVLIVGMLTGEHIVLGLTGNEMVMLMATLLVSILTFASGRTNVLQGAVHILLFLAYVMLIFD